MAEGRSSIHKGITEEQLLARAKEGDENAFRLLINIYQQRLYGFIFNKSRSMKIFDHELDDIYQTVLINAWRYLPKFRGDSKLYTWLCSIAINVMRTQSTKNKEKFPSFGLDGDNIDQFAHDETNPESQAIALEQAQARLEIIETIPIEWRKAYELVVFERLPYEEVSLQLGVPVGTIKSRIYRARNFIIEKLEESGFLD